MSTVIIIPPPEPRRREIEKDGITYREVLPGDDATGWDILLGILVFIFVLLPGGFALIAWVIFPMFNFIFEHSPLK